MSKRKSSELRSDRFRRRLFVQLDGGYVAVVVDAAAGASGDASDIGVGAAGGVAVAVAAPVALLLLPSVATADVIQKSPSYVTIFKKNNKCLLLGPLVKKRAKRACGGGKKNKLVRQSHQNFSLPRNDDTT